MPHLRVRALVLGSCLLFAGPAVWAQKDRIREPIDATKRVLLPINVSSNARAEFDQGPVDPSMKINYIQMMFKPSDTQQATLDQLLVDQQDPASPSFHKWLTPEQYADQFGLSANDVHQVETWLTSQGFSLIQTAQSRNWIAFDGTAAQVRNAFATEIRHYQVNGKLHYANATPPSIPAAIEPLVRSILGLNDFRVERVPGKMRQVSDPKAGFNGQIVMTPPDLATIYDVNPLYQQGITGTGQKMVIIGDSGIYLEDIRAFRSAFGLPANDPEVMLIPGGTDPGITGGLAEADLDLEESGGIAPGTKQYFIYASDFINALNYSVQANIAPVISMSFGFCEADASQLGIGANFMEPVAEQAASQGISIIVSSGDGGATMCDQHATSATHGLAVNLFASAPDVTAVGGTMFTGNNSTYFSSTGAALSYVPETSWNENAVQGSLFSSAGGLSIVYPKPGWQSGNGFPTANQRGVPDIAFTSAANDDGYFVISNNGAGVYGGTSAATPLFAGMVTLLNQYTKSNGQGSLNPNIYRLAQSTGNIFHDITTGNNFVPCTALSTNCSGGQEGYSAGPGYDLVTGWGSVDASRLIQGWAGGQLQTTLTVTANPPSFALNGSTTLTATVQAIGSSGNPTGTVTFLLGGVSLGANTLTATGSGTSTASVTIFASQLPAGEDTIEATYSGDRTFTPSVATISVGVSVPVGSSAVIPSINPNPVYQRTTASGATGWFFTVTLNEVAGTATTLTNLTINGTSYASSIASFFGTTAIPAYGTISAALQDMGATPPATLTFVFSGTDPNGRAWSQQLSAQLLGPQLSGLITLSGLPNTLQQNPNIQGAYQWCQDVGVAEQNGHTVYLTKFLANGEDLSSQINDFFGGYILSPFGALLASDICWDITSSLPLTLTYQMSGIDDEGNTVSTTLSPTFVPAASNPTSLSASTEFLTFGVGATGQSTKSSVNVNVNQGQQWSVSLFPSNPSTTWLSVYPSSGTGPATVNLTASAQGLSPGLYLATLVFQSTNAVPQYYNTYIYFTVGTPQITQVINSATLTDTPSTTANTTIAPGLIFTLRGNGLGSIQPLYYYVDDNGDVANDNYGVQVFVNGYACPLLYVGQGQINAIAPYEIANNVGQTVNVQVVDNGVKGNVFPVTVAATAPGIFSLGGNQGAVQNLPSYATNGPGSPAPRGSTIVIYGSGEGQLNTGGVDGSFANQTSIAALPHPTASVQVLFNGNISGNVSYAGTVPGSFEGFFQVDVQVPTNIPPGTTSVVLVVGGQQSVPQNIVVQ